MSQFERGIPPMESLRLVRSSLPLPRKRGKFDEMARERRKKGEKTVSRRQVRKRKISLSPIGPVCIAPRGM